jgi:hypothetical protein
LPASSSRADRDHPCLSSRVAPREIVVLCRSRTLVAINRKPRHPRERSPQFSCVTPRPVPGGPPSSLRGRQR